MGVACIVRCIGVAVFVVSLQAGAQPPEGKGRAEHPGASPFIRFPVPQHSVGLAMRSFSRSQGAGRAGEGLAQNGAIVVSDAASGAVKVKAAKFAAAAFPATAAPVAGEKRAALPECGAR